MSYSDLSDMDLASDQEDSASQPNEGKFTLYSIQATAALKVAVAVSD